MMGALVVGNWKMNLDFVEAIHLTQQMGVMLRNQPLNSTELIVAPPFVDLRSVSSVVESERIPVQIAAQHMNAHDAGAHTGEVSSRMLRRLSVTSVIVGHSERRQNYGMTDDDVASTTATAIRSDLIPILCCGESLEVREAEDETRFVAAQIESAFEGLSEKDRDRVVVAYEPIWAIGTGIAADTSAVSGMTSSIRSTLTSLGVASGRVLYGGSVTAENASDLLSAGVDGFLVGGASLKAESFLGIARLCDDWYSRKR